MGSRATRDLALFRIGNMTRWMAAGTLVAGGVLSAAVAKALPGHASHRSAPSSVTVPQQPGGGSSAGSQGANSTGDNGSAAGLAPPAQAPQPVQAPPVVNSGGS